VSHNGLKAPMPIACAPSTIFPVFKSFALSQPVFLTKEQRAAMALEKRRQVLQP
jgi:hypothetical protein